MSQAQLLASLKASKGEAESKESNHPPKPNLPYQRTTVEFLEAQQQQANNQQNKPIKTRAARTKACGNRAEAHLLAIPPPATPVTNSRSPAPSLSLSPDSGDSPIDHYDQCRIDDFNAISMSRPKTVSPRKHGRPKDFEFKEEPDAYAMRPQSTVGAGHFEQMILQEISKRYRCIDLDPAQPVKRVGRGADADVHKAKFKGREIVLKKFKIKQDQDPMVALCRFHNELNILKMMRNEKVTLYLGFHLTGMQTAHQDIRIAFECAPQGSLFQRLHPIPVANQEIEQLSFRDALSILTDIAEGMVYVHSKRVIHRDLNPRNVLLYGDGSTAKITDFGESFLVDKNENWKKPNITEKMIVGSAGYKAPEMLIADDLMKKKKGKFTNNDYNYKVDVFAFGSVCFETLTRQMASGQSVLKSWVELEENNQLDLIPCDCPPEFGQIMYECWSFNPKERPEFSTIVEDLKSETLLSECAKMDAL